MARDELNYALGKLHNLNVSLTAISLKKWYSNMRRQMPRVSFIKMESEPFTYSGKIVLLSTIS